MAAHQFAMIQWSFRKTVALTASTWAILTFASVHTTGDYSISGFLSAGFILAFMVGLLAVIARGTILSLLKAEFEPRGAGTAAYPVRCPGCGLETEYCVQKGAHVLSGFGAKIAEVGEGFRMFCPDCGRAFSIGPGEFERSQELASSLEEYGEGEISIDELRQRIYSFEEDVGFVPNPDPRLRPQEGGRAGGDGPSERIGRGFQ